MWNDRRPQLTDTKIYSNTAMQMNRDPASKAATGSGTDAAGLKLWSTDTS